MKKVLCWNDAMTPEEAEAHLSYLVNKYDKNHDGKFDYSGGSSLTFDLDI